MLSQALRQAEERANAVVKQFETLRSNRGPFEGHWQEIAEVIWPSQSRLFQSQREGNLLGGEKRTEKIFDTTGSMSLNRFAAILDSILTPMAQTWAETVPSDPYLLKDRETRLWYEDLNRLLFQYRYAARSNFLAQNQLVYKMLGAYGTGVLFIDDLATRRGPNGLRYRNIHLSEMYIWENHQGIIDGGIRYFPFKARQVLQAWPNTAPQSIRDAAKNDPEKEFFILHRVLPRDDYDPDRRDYKGMEYASEYVSVTERAMLSEGGYDAFPYGVSRYEQVPGEVYGRSPAMDVLPAIKTLNEEKKTLLKQGHKALDPTLLAHDDGVMDVPNLRPGYVNWGGVNADGRPLVHAIPVGNIAVGKELMDDERVQIKDAFLETFFQFIVQNPQMTATEVMERVKEKNILIAPTVGRQHSEYISPMVEREISLLIRQRKVRPYTRAMLEAKEGGDFRTEYRNPMARSQRAEEVSGAMRTIETAISVSTQTQNPAPLDHFNFDVIIPEIADIQGMPARWRNDEDTIANIRKSRASAAQEEQDNAAAPGAAALINATAKAQKVAEA